jgi:hypothetical protein
VNTLFDPKQFYQNIFYCFFSLQFILSCFISAYPMSRDSSVGTDWTATVRFLAEARNFSLTHNAQTVSVTQPTGIEDSFPGKTAGA